MNQLVATILSVLIILLPITIKAETICKEPISVTSPCTGVLLPPSAATQGLECLKITVPKLTLELKRQEELYGLKIETMTKMLTAEVTRAERIEGLLNKSLETTEDFSFFEGPVFWAVIGVVVGAATSIGIAYAMSNAARQ
tara:strand:- start:205 stop:627 length:423 start_codon:yes stop_codon:yes gene_type:complete